MKNEWGRVMGPVAGVLKTTGRGVTCCESGSSGALCHCFSYGSFPHFMAIAWMYRKDYTCAGYLNSTFGGAEGSLCDLAEPRFFHWLSSH